MALVVSSLSASACAPLQGPLSSRFAGCGPVSAESSERRIVEEDIAAFLRTASTAGGAQFEVHDCEMDGQLYDGRTIILSARLARLPQTQRYFIIAHEFAHHRLNHSKQIDGSRAGIVSQPPETGKAVDAIELAHRTEFEADAYAVRMMHAEGLDPEEAAQLFDGIGPGEDSATHPASGRRAQAIRDLIGALKGGLPAPTSHAGR